MENQGATKKESGVKDLLRAVGAKRLALAEAKRLYQDRLAPDFNPFDFIKPDEVRLSEVLAWLLRPEGSHGQGSRFLALFLEQLGADWPTEACLQATVETEKTAGGERFDVIITSGARCVIVENKPQAPDQPGQVQRYFMHLDKFRSRAPAPKSNDFALVYMTKDGFPPSDNSIGEADRLKRIEGGQLHCWSYREHVLQWLKQCRAMCRADRVSVFLDEFARYIQKTYAGVSDVTEQNQILEEILASATTVDAAMTIVVAGGLLKTRLIEMLRTQLLVAAKQNGWGADENIRSTYRATGVNFDFSPDLPYVFRIEFEFANYNGFCYGVSMKNKRTKGVTLLCTALQEKLGTCEETGPLWPWWRYSSLQDDRLPFDRNWESSAQPWSAILGNKMANLIINTAGEFRTAMLSAANHLVNVGEVS